VSREINSAQGQLEKKKRKPTSPKTKTTNKGGNALSA